MQELLRFTGRSNGLSLFLPPKFDFVFYEDKFVMYRGSKVSRTVAYSDITEVVALSKKVTFINCKPIGINIYESNDELLGKIKEITGK